MAVEISDNDYVALVRLAQAANNVIGARNARDADEGSDDDLFDTIATLDDALGTLSKRYLR